MRPQAMIASQEMCQLRKRDRLFTTSVKWKVTSRYVLWLTETKKVDCVRVSSNYNAGAQTPAVVLHLSEAEYRRLFRALPTKGSAK